MNIDAIYILTQINKFVLGRIIEMFVLLLDIFVYDDASLHETNYRHNASIIVN